MLVSCVAVCHNKPDVTHEAIQSVLDQTYPHWELIVIDSGELYDAGYYERFDCGQDERVRIVRSAETEETRRTKAMAPWCFNECFRRGWASGELVSYLCDDDLLYPNAFRTFADYFERSPHALAVYASQDLGVIYPDGRRAIVGERRATRVGGRCVRGRILDRQVDYLQLCHKREVLAEIEEYGWWPEEKATEDHADGIFMERIGFVTPILPIDVKVSQNRRTPRSTYVPSR
jgi:spore maturation protein CgeD